MDYRLELQRLFY